MTPKLAELIRASGFDPPEESLSISFPPRPKVTPAKETPMNAQDAENIFADAHEDFFIDWQTAFRAGYESGLEHARTTKETPMPTPDRPPNASPEAWDTTICRTLTAMTLAEDAIARVATLEADMKCANQFANMAAGKIDQLEAAVRILAKDNAQVRAALASVHPSGVVNVDPEGRAKAEADPSLPPWRHTCAPPLTGEALAVEKSRAEMRAHNGGDLLGVDLFGAGWDAGRDWARENPS